MLPTLWVIFGVWSIGVAEGRGPHVGVTFPSRDPVVMPVYLYNARYKKTPGHTRLQYSASSMFDTPNDEQLMQCGKVTATPNPEPRTPNPEPTHAL